MAAEVDFARFLAQSSAIAGPGYEDYNLKSFTALHKIDVGSPVDPKGSNAKI